MHFPLVLTQGDPAGIGPEIALKAWERKARTQASPSFFLLGDVVLLARTARALNLPAPIEIDAPERAHETFLKGLPVIALHEHVSAEPGRPDSAHAAATVESIRRAVAYVQSGRAAAVVTNPIAKKPLYDAGFGFPGHTEFLAELAGGDPAPRPVMMIWSPLLAVVPITIHVALSEVPRLLTQHLILATARIVAREMRTKFGVERPRLAFAGLNPHAGEGGAMGREEIEVMAPAIEALRAEGIDAIGPLPADTMFHARARANFDVALTPYHDQGLIPAKTLAFDEGVNVTLGLPFVRTSPDHGVAYDIAGKGVANPSSLIAALDLAARLTRA